MTDQITVDSAPIQYENKGDNQSLAYDLSVRLYTPPIGPDAREYKMNHEKRGRAFIFNHEKYHESLKLMDRTGTNTDKIILKQHLEKLNFEVDVYDDLPTSDIKKHLDEFAKLDHKNEDCVVVAVLTHGSEKGKLCAYNDFYKVDMLCSSFKADLCPSLAGKPKIFIVQACRGEEMSHAMKFKSSIQPDSNKMEESKTSHRYSIPVEADILFAFSTYEGRVALRDTKDGTWFIQELCKELEDNGDKVDLLALFTNVNRRVAVNKEYKNMKQMPVIQSTLTRKLFFDIHSKIIQTDVSIKLQETNEKLDNITKMLEDKKPSIPVAKTKPRRIQSSSWDIFQSPKETMMVSMPPTDRTYKIAEAIKMFLEDEAVKLTPAVKDDGKFLLNFVSCWENLNEELKCYAYKKMAIFLNENARNWKVYKFLDIPESALFGSEHCHRRWSSHSDVTDAASTLSVFPRRVPKKFK